MEVFKTLGVKEEFSTAYHSRGNSICERALKWIQNTMAKLSKSKRKRWDVKLKNVGQNPELVELVDVAKETYKEAKLNLENTLKNKSERKTRDNELRVNEYVYVKLPDTSCGSKLALEWSGSLKYEKLMNTK
uniref:Integrase catalytic domain-containing protein n=1 Tax=Strongyloides venezuelensis TaxID=75913 RepID=A0A0K0FNQ5_STRVS